MDTFNERLRRIGLMLDYGQPLAEIHRILKPSDEADFFLVYMAALRRHRAQLAESVDVGTLTR